MAAGNEAILSNEKKFTVFQYDRYVIRFKAPYSLERYTKVKEWDHGYLVVMAKYVHNDKEEEEYIDLVPILENLYCFSDRSNHRDYHRQCVACPHISTILYL